MKKLFLFSAILALFVSACDKVDNAYPEQTYTGGLDATLYPGNILDYVEPTFAENTNTNRNILIEDFTGHHCLYCPLAATEAHNIETANPGRVFISTIHSGPLGTGFGTGGNQGLTLPDYTYDFTNPIGNEIGLFFGSLAGNNFSANPSGTVSRIKTSSGVTNMPYSGWASEATAALNANDLKVNIQSVVNYFPTTQGAFIHIEVDVLEPIANELRLIVAFHEDSIVKPQLLPNNTTNLNYVHRDLLKSHVNGEMFGQKLTDDFKAENGNYYFDYSFKIPAAIEADNAHLLIYVLDKQTNEIYQVIKKKFL